MRQRKAIRFVEIDAARLRAEVKIRAWTNERFAKEIGRHPNTADRILGAQKVASVDADTAANIALAFQRTRPFEPLVALQPRAPAKIPVNGIAHEVRATPRLPIVFDPNPRINAHLEAIARIQNSVIDRMWPQTWVQETLADEAFERIQRANATVHTSRMPNADDSSNLSLERFVQRLRELEEMAAQSKSEVAVT